MQSLTLFFFLVEGNGCCSNVRGKGGGRVKPNVTYVLRDRQSMPNWTIYRPHEAASGTLGGPGRPR